MEELSLHILDLVQNSLGAGAGCIEIVIEENTDRDLFLVEIHDNGKGMSREFVERVLNPFTTTRTTRRVGLGLSLLEMATRQCNGGIKIDSEPGRGTKVRAVFQHSHWDRAPLGNIKATLITIISANPRLRLVYSHQVNDRSFSLDTDEVVKILGEDIPLNHMAVLDWLENYLSQGLNELYGGE
jgi:hypothetical protein